MTDAHAWAERLAGGGRIAEPVAVVVAHPDDETLFAGPVLRRLANATLILLTDGAPEDMGDARRLGFATRADYARARAVELDHALAALGAAARLVRYEVPDQRAVERIGEVAARLAVDLAGHAAVITHPYEGGHPDHDAAALAVRRAAERLAPAAPAIVEFACYAQFGGERVWSRFVDTPTCPERLRMLDEDDRARLDAALAAHATQAAVFGAWRPTVERWRAAPPYDFALPPPGEACLYDGFGWAMTSQAWRAHAAQA